MASLVNLRARGRRESRLWSHWAKPEGRSSNADGADDEIGALLEGLAATLGADAALATLHPAHCDPLLVARAGCDLTDMELAQIVDLADSADRRLPALAAGLADYDWASIGLSLRLFQVLRLSIADHASGGRIVLSLLCGNGRPSPEAAAPLNAARPYLEAYLRVWQQNRELDRRARGLTAALDCAGAGVFLVDGFGGVRQANKLAVELVETGDYLRLSDGALSAADLSDGIALQVAINDAIATGRAPGNGAAGRTPVLALRSHLQDRPMIVTVVPSGSPAADRSDIAAIVYALVPEEDCREQMQAVCKLYGLSPVETRLALLISSGASLQQAANALHIKEQTARSYLKQIFLKTDTRRQGDLVRVVLSSVLRLRTGFPIEVVEQR